MTSNATNSPSIGLLVGRVTNSLATGAADGLAIYNPTIVGWFKIAPYFNRDSETTNVYNPTFINRYDTGYVMALDGANTLNVQSAFANTGGNTYPQNTNSSFNDNQFIGGRFEAWNNPTANILITGGPTRMQFHDSYLQNSGPHCSGSCPPTSQPAFLIGVIGGFAPKMLDVDAHVESESTHTALGNVFQFYANASTANLQIESFSYHDPIPFPASGYSIFALGTNVSALTMLDAKLQVGTLSGGSTAWFDTQANWTIYGYVFSQDDTFASDWPNLFQGVYCSGNGTDLCSLGRRIPLYNSAASSLKYKYLSIDGSGNFQVINSANSSAIMTLTDTGNLQPITATVGSGASSANPTSFVINNSYTGDANQGGAV